MKVFLTISLVAILSNTGLSAPPPPSVKEPTNPFVAWSVAADSNQNAFNGATVVKDFLIVGSDRGDLFAFSCKTGKRVATYQTKGWVWAVPSISKTHVYFGSQDKGFYCFEKSTGKQVWRYETKGRADSGGTLDDESVYFGSSDGALYCVNIADGKERWKFAATPTTGRRKGVYSAPVVKKNMVYFASCEGVAYALATHSGDVIWKKRLAEDSDVYSATVTLGTNFFWVTRPSGGGKEEQKGVSAVVAWWGEEVNTSSVVSTDVCEFVSRAAGRSPMHLDSDREWRGVRPPVNYPAIHGGLMLLACSRCFRRFTGGLTPRRSLVDLGCFRGFTGGLTPRRSQCSFRRSRLIRFGQPQGQGIFLSGHVFGSRGNGPVVRECSG